MRRNVQPEDPMEPTMTTTTARYDGTCRYCLGAIQVGETVDYDRTAIPGQRAAHPSCAAAATAIGFRDDGSVIGLMAVRADCVCAGCGATIPAMTVADCRSERLRTGDDSRSPRITHFPACP